MSKNNDLSNLYDFELLDKKIDYLLNIKNQKVFDDFEVIFESLEEKFGCINFQCIKEIYQFHKKIYEILYLLSFCNSDCLDKDSNIELLKVVAKADTIFYIKNNEIHFYIPENDLYIKNLSLLRSFSFFIRNIQNLKKEGILLSFDDNYSVEYPISVLTKKFFIEYPESHPFFSILKTTNSIKASLLSIEKNLLKSEEKDTFYKDIWRLQGNLAFYFESLSNYLDI